MTRVRRTPIPNDDWDQPPASDLEHPLGKARKKTRRGRRSAQARARKVEKFVQSGGVERALKSVEGRRGELTAFNSTTPS